MRQTKQCGGLVFDDIPTTKALVKVQGEYSTVDITNGKIPGE